MTKSCLACVSWFVMLVFLLASPVALADEARLLNMMEQMQETINQMQKTINQQDAKIRSLERREPSISTAPSTSGEVPPPMSDYEFNERLSTALGGANKWLKDLSFKGDLRLRYEAFDFHSGNPAESDSRNRFRYRLRMGWEKKFGEEMKIGFSLASGESAAGVQTDPTSTNTTFDKLFNFKDIFIEKAFASYSPAWAVYGPLTKTTITAGKMDNAFEKGSSDMVWDRDVKPEGIIEKFDFNLYDGENADLTSYFTAGQFVLDEDAISGQDAELFAYQLGLNAIVYTPFFERPVDALSAVSFYSWNDYATKNNFTIDGTDTTAGTALSSGTRGNINAAGSAFELDAQDFEVWEYYNEIAFYPYGVPIRPFFDLAHNAANQHVGDEGLAFSYGTKLGGIVKKGDWELNWAYKRIESEAVPAAFNDSDFGNGHTGKRGNVFKASYALTDVIFVNGAMFYVNNTAANTSSVRDEEQRRFQLDLLLKF